jgi:hypothetical protein
VLFLWDVASCSLVEIDRCFRGVYCLHHQALKMKAVSTTGSDYEGKKHLWNVSQLTPDYNTQHPRRQSPSHSPPWKPGMSLITNFLIMSFSALPSCLASLWSEYSLQRHSIYFLGRVEHKAWPTWHSTWPRGLRFRPLKQRKVWVQKQPDVRMKVTGLSVFFCLVLFR